jgi:MYXO-CTERM domain-containing protein
VVVESWRIDGMGHAFPIGEADPEHGCGTVAAYFEDRGLCGAYRALEFFGMPGGGDDDDGDGGGDGGGGDGEGDGGGGDDGGGDDAGGGCQVAGGGAGGSVVYALLALVAAAMMIARRRRSTRSILPAPVRGSRGTSSKRRGCL